MSAFERGETLTEHLTTTDRPTDPSILGTHCLLDLFECERTDLLDDGAALVELLATAAERSGATVLLSHHHRFQPQGVTAFCVLAESHISIHTWPETGSASVDVYTCGDHCVPEVACGEILAALRPRRQGVMRVDRGQLRTARVAGSQPVPQPVPA